MYWILLVVICFIIVCSSYHQFHCPSRTEWRIRAKWNCNGSSTAIYTCLFNDFTHKYEEACKYNLDILDPGEQYILSHLPRGEKCKSANKYQPFSLSLNTSSECVLAKSICNGEGQVLFYSGSSREDRSCRCDFENGYAFVNKLKHSCKCNPALEDCSCYIKQCSLHFKLAQDYSCVHNDNSTYISPCPDMVVTRSRRHNETSDMLLLRIEEHYGNRSNIAAILVSIILGLLLVGILALTVLSEKMPGLLYPEISAPYNIKVTRENMSLKLTWSKPGKGSDDIIEYRIYYACNSTWVKNPFTVKGADNLCFYVTSDRINFDPKTTYRFRISAYTSSLEESVQSVEKTFDTGLPEQPQNFEVDGRNGTITLAWSSPRRTLFNIDKFKLDIILDSVKTVELSAGMFTYKIEEAQHETYCFRIYSCTKELMSEPLERIYIGEHAYHSDMAFHISHNKRMDERIGKLEKIIDEIPEIFANGTKNTPGEQAIIYKKAREGSLLLELVFTSRNFYDEKRLRGTIKNAFERNRIGEWELILREFSFQALNQPAPPESVKANHQDNIVTVTWREPKVTFFKTERFIVQVMTKYGLSTHTKDYEVPNDQMAYSVFDVLPSTTIEFTIYTGICHSIRSYGSDMTCICVEGPSPPQEVKANSNGSSIEITWTKPLHPIMKFVKQFKIKVTEDQTSFHHVVSGDTFKYELVNCKPLTNYRFQLSTLTSNEFESKDSKPVEIQTQAKVNENAMAQVHVEENRLTQTGTFAIQRQHTIEDIKLLQNGQLVLSDRYEKQLITCSVNGEELKNIQVNGYPLCITLLDDWKVAVSLMILDNIDKTLRHFEIALVDIQTLNVTGNIGWFKCVTPSCPVTFANNNLYVHAKSGEIEIMNIYGHRKTKIELSNSAITLSDISYVKNSDNICGMSNDGNHIISIDQNGICKSIYVFKEDSSFDRQLAIDKDENYLVFCSQRDLPAFKVYKIYPGEDSRVKILSSKINTLQEQKQYASFCVQNLLKTTIVVVKCNEVHVYSYKKL